MRRRKENGDRCHDCERRKDYQTEPRIGKKYEDQDNCEDVTIMNNAKIVDGKPHIDLGQCTGNCKQ